MDALLQQFFLNTWTVLAGLVAIGAIGNFVVKRLILHFVQKILRATGIAEDDYRMVYGVVARIANIAPALIIILGIGLIPDIPETLTIVIRNVAIAYIILTVALAFSAGLNAINAIYSRQPHARSKPIKGYLQLVKLLVFIVAVILIVATLVDKSPLILLSGLGAMAAVLMLVFQDTILSLVASVQISSSDMVRVGDWIEMPQLNADGDVIDIALHTVKVQNWDKTITTLPTRRLITDPFKNWRGMQESGGRRMKRSIQIDQNSIHFLTEEEMEYLRKFTLLQDYLEQKDKELEEWNRALGERKNAAVNTRRLTNIGTFRAYVKNYIHEHEGINNDMTQLVRQLSPGPDGLPIEIYCFTNTTAWAGYEGIQSDIFDHLYSILPEFGLAAYQQISGTDLRAFNLGEILKTPDDKSGSRPKSKAIKKAEKGK